VTDVVWECEYPNANAHAADVARLDASREFNPAEAHMQTLIHQSRRTVFSVLTLE
jgi:G:T-mismatch repair DNA endonuclease (very short patch repair protein)